MTPIATGAAVSGALSVAAQTFGALEVATKKYQKGNKYLNNVSLIDVTQVARVEPIALIDVDCMNLEYVNDVVETMHTLFSGYYLQAINLLGNVGGVSVAKRLAPLNPNRGIGFESYDDWRLDMQAYAHKLPTSHNKPALESKGAPVVDRSMNATDKEVVALNEVSNLCVGKLFNVVIRNDDQSVTVPVAIRLMVSNLPTNTLVNMLTFKDNFDMDMKERYHAWRAGRLSFIKDLILCRDLIEKHRNAIINDKSGVYAEMLKRENNNMKSGLLNNNPSLATASNLVIISSETLADIEHKINGKFSNFKVRQAVFENTNLMIMAVVDKDWGMTTFYFRGMTETTQVSVRGLRSSKKGGGSSEVLDVMKAFISGSNPSL